MKLSELEKPILIVSKKRAGKNIDNFIKKSIETKTSFRPHFKTHQSAEIADLFKQKGVEKIAVSNMDMANFFINQGFKDICLAIPLNPNLSNQINKIPKEIKFTIFAEAVELIKHLEVNLKRPVDFMIKTDSGYGRTGVKHNDFEKIEQIINTSKESKKLHFRGFAVHNGNTYQAKSKNDVLEIHKNSKDKLNILKEKYADYKPIISMGDTPSVSISNDFKDVDEMRPGNFVYYDLMQLKTGSCNYKDIACLIAAPVLSTHYERDEILIHAGAVHMSKEAIDDTNNSHYGEIVKYSGSNFFEAYTEKSYLSKISQEHGIIKIYKKHTNKLKPGDTVFIIPIHSCLTANLMKNDTYYL